jgi:hypothetical protein
MNYEIAHLGCLPSPARYLSCRSLMDSSAGREDHREQIGPDVEAATRRYIIGRFDLGSRRGVAALGMRRAGASSPVIILWHAKCVARRFLAPDNRMRVGVVAQPSFKLYPWRPAILTPVYGWFTEGFDTLDLKEAKALLDELQT